MKKKGKVTGLRLRFSGGLEPSTTGNPANYQLALVKKGRTRKAPVHYVPVLLSSPSYNAAADTVTLVPPQAAQGGHLSLLVMSSSSGGVLDVAGQPLARDSETIVLSGLSIMVGLDTTGRVRRPALRVTRRSV